MKSIITFRSISAFFGAKMALSVKDQDVTVEVNTTFLVKEFWL